jgi:hypothetical protein
MPRVYWLSDGVGLDVNKGGPDGQIAVATAMLRWIRTNGSPDLIVNGGDMYRDGKTTEFTKFFEQMDRDLSLICETPGNHDWHDDHEGPETGRIPLGYDTFWRNHPESRQPVDTTKKGGARYEHVLDIGGWRLIFLDTGDYEDHPWPGDDQSRVTWLKNSFKPGRANILVAHHSRLSRGRHGDNDDLDVLWRALFDDAGTPRVAFTIAGHDHNVSVYGPRSRDNPEGASVSFNQGIHVFVNGAGGNGHYSGEGFLGIGVSGTRPDIFFDDDNYCVTHINLIDDRSADVDVLNFGKAARTDPTPVAQSLVKIRL